MGYYDYDDADADRIARQVAEAQEAASKYEAAVQAQTTTRSRSRAPRTAGAEKAGSPIRQAVLDFCRSRIGKTYRNGELWIAVEESTGRACAPDSPRRELRYLVADGLVGADCVDQGAGLHQIFWVK